MYEQLALLMLVGSIMNIDKEAEEKPQEDNKESQ